MPGVFTDEKMKRAKLRSGKLLLEDPLKPLIPDENTRMKLGSAATLGEARLAVRFSVSRLGPAMGGRLPGVMSWTGLPYKTVVFGPDGGIVENETRLRYRDGHFEDSESHWLPSVDWGEASVVRNARYQIEWVLDDLLKSQLEGKGGLPVSVPYRMVACRDGGATPAEFAGCFGIRVLTRDTEEARTFDESSGLPSNRVSCASISGNSLWVGAFDAGLCRVDLASGKVSRPTGSDAIPRDVSVLAGHDGKLFVGTFRHGLYLLDIAQGKAKRIAGVLGKRINCMILAGRDLWIGTDDGISVVRVSTR